MISILEEYGYGYSNMDITFLGCECSNMDITNHGCEHSNMDITWNVICGYSNMDITFHVISILECSHPWNVISILE